MYPNLYYFVQDVFGLSINGLKLVNTFGFFVALCFIGAAWVVSNELKRKQNQGLISYQDSKIVVGAPASFTDLLSNFVLGFIFGYKIIGAFVLPDALSNPQSFILSLNGHFPAGIFIGGVFAFIKWYEKNKQKLAKPETRTIRIWPHDKVGDLVIIAAIFGFAGAKVFHNLENWNEFVKNPLDALISFSGLTFYGGLICAALAIIFFAKKNAIPVIHLADAFAPALMLGYAIGRIGCQVSGDGDWGIVNSAFVCDASGKVIAANAQEFTNALHLHHGFYVQQFGSLTAVKHVSLPAFAHLPNWLFAYNYPHNVIGEGIAFTNCSSQPYCAYLPLPVFPTPFYETIMCLVLFGVLWFIRKRIQTPGLLVAIYLIFNGVERFLIEQIRVNTKYEGLPFQPTQAELIALLLILSGLATLVLVRKTKPANA